MKGVISAYRHMKGVISAYFPFWRQASLLVTKGWEGTRYLGRTAWVVADRDLRVKPTSPVSQLHALSDVGMGGVERRWKQHKKFC